MHETRYLGVDAPTLTGGSTYYGSADATPLFVMLLGELSRWGLGEESLRTLLPNADRALEWMEQYGDRDGDGYIEYMKTSDRGLSNQGWKDSADGIRYRDGSGRRGSAGAVRGAGLRLRGAPRPRGDRRAARPARRRRATRTARHPAEGRGSTATSGWRSRAGTRWRWAPTRSRSTR